MINDTSRPTALAAAQSLSTRTHRSFSSDGATEDVADFYTGVVIRKGPVMSFKTSAEWEASNGEN